MYVCAKNVQHKSTSTVFFRSAPNISDSVLTCVDVNRRILYVYTRREYLFKFDMDYNFDGSIRTEAVLIPKVDIEFLKSITIDPHGNFLMLYDKGDLHHELKIYDPDLNFINKHTLLCSHFHRDRDDVLTVYNTIIQSIVHHPSRNQLFVTTDTKHTAMLGILKWSPESYATFPVHIKSIILSFMMLAYYEFLIPNELSFLIFEFLFNSPSTIDIVGVDQHSS